MKPTFRLPRPARLLASLLISGGLMMGAAHAQQPPPVEEAEADTTVFPAQELTPQILYQLLLAEVAGARGQVAMAAQSYMDLAKRTRDPRIARRAAEIAVVTRQADLASEAARLWMELDPGSMQARQLASGAMASNARIEELQAHLAKALAGQGENIGAALIDRKSVV